MTCFKDFWQCNGGEIKTQGSPYFIRLRSSQNVNFWEYSKQFKKTQVAQSIYLSAQIRFEFFVFIEFLNGKQHVCSTKFECLLNYFVYAYVMNIE